MKSQEENLRFLGLSKEEITLYMTCLEFGDLSVARISSLTGIGRVNAYHHLEKLKQKGIITEFQKNKMKHFSAENPKIFINQEKERLNRAQELVPELLAIAAKGSEKPKIQFFEGTENLKKIFQKMADIRSGEIVSFSNFENLQSFFEAPFLQEHFQARLENKTKTRFISPRSHISENFIAQVFPSKFDKKLLETFLISPDEFHFESEITIFSGSIAILNLNPENPVGALIENPKLYRTQKAIFDLAWLGATSFITQ